jgi:hypothetical protein
MQTNYFAVYAAVLVTLIISAPTLSVTCESKCPVYIQAQGMCFSDGKLYTDSCQASCSNPKLVSLFKCKFPFSPAEALRCGDQCKDTISGVSPYEDCVSKCSVYPFKKTICASNGKLYMDECRAKCTDRSLSEIFNCNLLNDADCQQKCNKKFDDITSCGKKCPVFKKKNTICANDGNLYESECKGQCVNHDLFEIFNCKKKSDDKCKAECVKQMTITNCQEKCPKLKRRLMYWCANNGVVYDDLCKAQCINPSIEFLWNCEERNIFTDNKPLCDKTCKAEFECPGKCKSLKRRWVCASNGKLYKNACRAQCDGQKVLKTLKRTCNLQKEKIKCIARAACTD